MRGDPRYKQLAPEQVFSTIYKEGVWGKSDDPSQQFYSGDGSHDNIIVDTYIGAVRMFLGSFDAKPDVVDLGCGDFSVGSRIRSMCNQYVACDIVPELVKFNREKYKSLRVHFMVLDMTRDELPNGDVVFIRQVFQHMSNKQILSALKKISSRYRYLVLSEHVPGEDNFVPNLDMPPGAATRLYGASGLVLTRRPFNLKVKNERQLCVAPGNPGKIRTTLYELS